MAKQLRASMVDRMLKALAADFRANTRRPPADMDRIGAAAMRLTRAARAYDRAVGRRDSSTAA